MADGTIDQEEVWDDTALVESWNEAFAEYKKYHSIAAKGGKVSPPPKATKKSFTNGDGATDKAPQLRVEVGDADDDEYDPSVGQASKSSQPSVGVDMPAVSTVAGAGGVALPQMLAAGVQDDSMKNLMMSWYYAGYYTGLHEGKQQGYASALQSRQQTQGG